jgi:hypothetical protein
MARILLEAKEHPQGSSFVTLTYDDDNLPMREGILVDDPWEMTLDYSHWQKFAKKLRHKVSFRFFMVGEYGDESQRPHYHAILFGVPIEAAFHFVEKEWAYGFAHVGEANKHTIQYTCGYVTKKLNKNSYSLGEREPERALTSRKPGLAANYADRMATWYMNGPGSKYLTEHGDIAKTVRIDGKVYPLDMYMVRRMRKVLGIPNNPNERAHMLGLEVERYERHDESVLEQARLRENKLVRRGARGNRTL